MIYNKNSVFMGFSCFSYLLLVLDNTHLGTGLWISFCSAVSAKKKTNELIHTSGSSSGSLLSRQALMYDVATLLRVEALLSAFHSRLPSSITASWSSSCFLPHSWSSSCFPSLQFSFNSRS